MAEVPPPAAVMLITAFLASFTEFASNTATIIIFLPVIAELVRLVLKLKICRGLDFIYTLNCDFNYFYAEWMNFWVFIYLCLNVDIINYILLKCILEFPTVI